jgi:hypothetical protein
LKNNGSCDCLFITTRFQITNDTDSENITYDEVSEEKITNKGNLRKISRTKKILKKALNNHT